MNLETQIIRAISLQSLIAVLLVMGLRADVTGPSQHVPAPQAVDAEVVNGDSVVIKLKAATSSLRGIEFLIRKQPEHGTLGKIVAEGKHEATISYTAAAAKDIIADEFRFAARIKGGAVSKAVPVKIAIRDAVASLKIPKELDFGPSAIGVNQLAKLKISNPEKIAVAISIPELLAPFSWTEKTVNPVSVLPGQTLEFSILYQPSESGLRQQELSFSTGAVTWVRGQGIAPFSIESETEELKWDGKQRARIGTIVLRNFDDGAQNVKIAYSDLLKGPDSTTISVTDKTAIKVELPFDQHTRTYTGSVTVSNGTYERRVAVNAQPVPPLLTLNSKAPLDFGQHKEGELVGEQTLSIKNTGGAPSLLKVKAGSPFKVTVNRGDEPVAPGETRKIAVKMETNRAQKYQSRIKLMLGSSVDEVIVKGVVTQAQGLRRVAKPVVDEAHAEESGGTESEKVLVSNPIVTDRGVRMDFAEGKKLAPAFITERYFAQTYGFSTVERNFSHSLASVQNLGLKNSKRKSLTIRFDPVENAAGYVVEMRRLGTFNTDNNFASYWIPLENVKVKTGKKEVTAKIKGLEPGGEFYFRVLAEDGTGSHSWPSVYKGFVTAPPLRWSWWVLVLTLAIVVIGLYAWQRWKG